jgi:hypothetical protein
MKRKTLDLAACSFTNEHGGKTKGQHRISNAPGPERIPKTSAPKLTEPDPAVPYREDENGDSIAFNNRT